MKSPFSLGLAGALLAAWTVSSPAAAAETAGIVEQVVSLDGAWRLEPAGGSAREVTVPGFWERERGLRDVHQATYRREFYSMGLQARGYRLADWFDIRPYNPSYGGFLRPKGVREEHREAYETLVKSFAPIAVFDKGYDALGPFPKPPTLKAGAPANRTLIVYNDAFSDERVELRWKAEIEGEEIAGETRVFEIPLGGHLAHPIVFTPSQAGTLRLHLASAKGGKARFEDTRTFTVE